MSYIYLSIAILAEIIATSALKGAQEMTKFWPSVLVVTGYVCAFYFLMLSLRTIPVGVAYAIWSGIGMIFVPIICYFLYRQVLDFPAIIGIFLIVTGVLVIQIFSTTH